MSSTKRLFIETVGCQMNVLDSELVVAALRRQGWGMTATMADADAIFFNTCSVRQHAEDKIYSALGRVRKQKQKKTKTNRRCFGMHGAKRSGNDPRTSSVG